MPKPSPARLTALRALETAGRSHRPIQSILDEHLRRTPLSAADRALCTELAYGVLRLERRLNWILDRFLRQPGKTSPLLRLLLIMSAYEGLCLTRIPAHATVSAATDLARHVLGAPYPAWSTACCGLCCVNRRTRSRQKPSNAAAQT